MDFTTDKEKMRDYHLLSKDEFLKTYSYLDESEYDATAKLVKRKKPNLSRYQFAEIPNNQEGQAFIGQLKAYLNKDRYHVVVKGQHMNDEAKANWRRYERGQPIALSTHLRVYVNDSIGN